MTINLDPIATARAWIITRHAASPNRLRPDLYRTTQVSEWDRRGRLYACTNGFVLFGAWVPDIESPLEPLPDYDEAPDAVVVASDPDNLGLAMMKHVAKHHDPDEEPDGYLRFSTRRGESAGIQPTLGESFARPEFVIDYNRGKQVVALGQWEDAYPDWRAVVNSHAPGELAGVGMSAEALDVLAAVAGYAPLGVRLGLGQTDRSGILVECLGTDPLTVFGVAMPNVVAAAELAEAV